jgi:hypothetical protein
MSFCLLIEAARALVSMMLIMLRENFMLTVVMMARV